MASRVAFHARLTLLPTSQGGRATPLPPRSMALLDIGTTFRGQQVFCDARVTLRGVGCLEPGGSCDVVLEPLCEDLWDLVQVGSSFTLHEGRAPKGDGVVLARLEPLRALVQ
jgi:hypothetical protein